MAWVRVILLLVFLSSGAGMAMVPNPFTTRPPAPLAAYSIPHTDVNPLGANFFLEREVEEWKRELTFKMARDVGIGWAKVQFSWESIEPKKGQFFDEKYRQSTWDKYDAIVALAEKYGLRLIVRLDRPPNWSRKDNQYPTAPPDNFKDYGDFVAAVVSRYRGRVEYYQIWNEPNIWPEWGARGVRPEEYVALLKVAYQRAKEANPNAVILSAPLAQTLEKSPRDLNEIDYLGAMYQAGARPYFDILLANGYGFDRPPQDPPDPAVLNFSRVMLLREVMVRNGDATKAVWLNEFGWNASPPTFPPEKLFWRRVTEEEQARYTYQGIQMARSWGWVGVVNIWYFRQVGDITADSSDYYFRLVDTDFTPRFAYYRIAELAQQLRVAPPGLQQETSPAAKKDGLWALQLVKGASGGTVLVSASPGDSLTFTFYGTEVALLYQGDADAGMLEVTVDGSTQEKRGVIDLYRPSASPQSRVTLAQGLSPGVHTLKLTVTAQRNPASLGRRAIIDGFEVAYRPSWRPFYDLVVLNGLSLLLLIASFRWKRAR
ncbi:MAG: cellulase family glycosylhydrolase [Chloroflexi bacterium]|nr:cellulase family glycosylhydrolase [Chloroflexota bacterium]